MTEKKIFCEMPYLIKYPKGYSADKKYPALLLFTGAGSRGQDLSGMLGNPFFKITDKHDDFPFIVFAPLCYKDSWFDLFETLIQFAYFINDRQDVDKSRFYAMGASMGGYATWQMGMSCPELFSAIVPICGGGMYWNSNRLNTVPVWAFHGDIDYTVFVEESKKMVDGVNKNGGNAKLTVYENCGHDAWSETYGNTEVFKWMLSHKKESAEINRTEFSDSKIYG